MLDDVTFRAAVAEDSPAIADLFRISSDGVVDYVWMTLASEYPGLEPAEIGRFVTPVRRAISPT